MFPFGQRVFDALCYAMNHFLGIRAVLLLMRGLTSHKPPDLRPPTYTRKLHSIANILNGDQSYLSFAIRHSLGAPFTRTT